MDEERVQKVIDDLLNKEAVFQNGHWSSAQNFEQLLKEKGFKSPVEISHKYRFPDGFTEESFENYIMSTIYIHGFSADRILNPQKYLEDLTNGTTITPEEKVGLLDKMLDITAGLTSEEKQTIINKFNIAKKYVLPNMAQFLDAIRKLNPEIATIHVSPLSLKNMWDLYIGMTSKFHPDDIKYFLETKDFSKRNAQQEEIKNLIGFAPNVFIEPTRMQQIINNIKSQKQMPMYKDMQNSMK